MTDQTIDGLVLKGEGGSNVVYEYTAEKCSQVIRIRKRRKFGSSDAQSPSNDLEQETWPSLFADAKPDQTLEIDANYIEKIIGPLIGPEYILPQKLINLTSKQLEVYGNGAEIEPQAVLMPDATLLPPPQLSTASGSNNTSPKPNRPTLCIEIKPKYGTITNCSTVRLEDVPLKHSNSRYRLHQLLKLEQGLIPKQSMYDPVDLFSDDNERMEAAVMALLEHPQNNLAFFFDGQRFPIDNAAIDPGHEIWNKVAGAILLVDSQVSSKSALASILAAILYQERVLANIAKAQQACPYDIEGIYHLYCKLIGEPAYLDFDASAGPSSHLEAIQKLLKLPHSAAVDVLRSYVIAATAKDCSIMIAMQMEQSSIVSVESKNQASTETDDVSCGLLPLLPLLVPENIDQSSPRWAVRYRISAVDLDRKPLSKIPKHYELDKEIVAAARRQQHLLDPLT